MKYSIFTVLLLACIASTLLAESPFERELKQLREQRDKTVAAAVEPINRKYQVSLDQLLRRATQGNDLQAAMKIKQEMETSAASIAALTTEPPKNRAARIKTELSGSIWSVLRGDRTITVTFAPEGALKQDPSPNAGFPAKWTIDEGGDLILDGRKATTKDKFKTFTAFFGATLTFVRKQN